MLTTHDDVYIPEPLPDIAKPEALLARERRRKGKAPMELPVSTGVPSYDPVPFTIFREERELTSQAPLIDEEPDLVIPTRVIESLYTKDSSGE